MGELLGTLGVVGIGAVADRLDGGEDVGELDLALVPAHARTPGGVVDLDRRHAGQAGDVVLVEPHARCAGDALEDQRGLALVLAHRAHEALLEVGMIEETELLQLDRHRLAARLGHRVAMAVVIDQVVVDDGLRHRLAANAAHAPITAVDAYVVPGLGRDRQAAVIAVAIRSGIGCGRGNRLFGRGHRRQAKPPRTHTRGAGRIGTGLITQFTGPGHCTAASPAGGRCGAQGSTWRPCGSRHRGGSPRRSGRRSRRCGAPARQTRQACRGARGREPSCRASPAPPAACPSASASP